MTYEEMIERGARAMARAHWAPGMTKFGWEPRTADEYADSEWKTFVPFVQALHADLEAAGYAWVPAEATEGIVKKMHFVDMEDGASHSEMYDAAIAAGRLRSEG